MDDTTQVPKSLLTKNDLALLLLALLVASMALLPGLGKSPLWNMDESRQAEVAREMAGTGNYIIPQLYLEPYYNKPPLLHYFIILSSKFFGGFNEWSARFPSVFSAVITLLCTFVLLKILFANSMHSFAGSMMLLSLFHFTGIARQCRPDMMMVAMMSVSLTYFAYWYFHDFKKRSHFNIWCFYVPLGLSYFAKGPQSIILCALIIFVFLALARDLASIRAMKPLKGAAIILLVISTWYLLGVIVYGQSFIDGAVTFIVRENLNMFLGKTDHTEKVIYYYAYAMPLYTLPWILFMPLAVYCSFKKRKKLNKQFLFLVSWIIVVFIFYTLGGARRYYYLLPLYPAFASFLSIIWISGDTLHSRISKILLYLPYLLLIMLFLGVLFLSDFSAGTLIKLNSRHVDYGSSLTGISVILVTAFTALLYMVKRGQFRWAMLALSIFIVVVNTIFLVAYKPLYNDADGSGGVAFCRHVSSIVRPEDECYLITERPYLPFYLNRYMNLSEARDVVERLKHPGNFYVVSNMADFRNLEESRDSFVIVYEYKRKNDDEHLMLIRNRK